jgi:hypothetical protein
MTAALVLVPGLTACSGSDPSRDTSPEAAVSSGASSAPPSSAPPSTGPAEETPSAADSSLTASSGAASSSAAARRLAGDGYSFALPAGWRDATEQFKEYSELIDAGAVNAEQDGQPFSDNVNVLRNADQAELPPAQAEHQFVEELGTVAEGVKVQPAATVDGVEVLHLSGRTVAGEVTALTDQYIAYVDDVYFVVTFSYDSGTPRIQRKAEVASMLASWTWE